MVEAISLRLLEIRWRKASDVNTSLTEPSLNHHVSFVLRAFTKMAVGPLQSGGGGQNTYR